MPRSRESQKSGGIGFFGLLTIVLITLKLCNVIAWTWIWVLSPLWVPLALGLGVIVVLLIAIALVAAVAAIAEAWSK
ncbi:hypothetical protein [Anatilimnocola floriformis]|uniref:hypothetical protein n=1 Tax=Anatilimnocola floriformis TaxID=2948575 RepID=UPI0020C2EB5F|nr:hypothetical protein [Anatilimnocola floriformis]